jgi:murein DD-endopeptidase MepM/ murein hydrolase activator NlpD
VTRSQLLLVSLLASFALAGCAQGFGGPRVISRFGSWYGPEGFPRPEGPHNGVDIAGNIGDPVLAVADGTVQLATEGYGDCGTIVVLDLKPVWASASYCHLASYTVSYGQSVKRGDVVGFIGATGRRPGLGFEHVHLTLRVGGRLVDPEDYVLGCFDSEKIYPTDRLVLTWPVKC